MQQRAEARSFKDATTRRTQPNWLVECIKLGIPYLALPTPPTHDAPYAEKVQYTWKLRKLWEQRTGRRIERLTPPGHNDKMLAKRRAERQAGKVAIGVIDQILDEEADSEERRYKNARRKHNRALVEDIRQGEHRTQIDTRIGNEWAARLNRVSPTVPEGYRWVPDADLPIEKVESRQASITRTVYQPARATDD